LIAVCNALRSENRPAPDSTVFDISLDGLGSGETVLIVFAKDREAALKLQAQMSQQLSAETDAQKTEDEAPHLCEGSETLPIASLVAPRPVAPAEPEPSTSDKDQQTPRNMEQDRGAASLQSQSPKSAWDACKQAVSRLFGVGSG